MSKKKLKTFRNKVILVTGGTGSIGSAIIADLLKHKPAQIRVFSRDETKQFYLQHELLKSETEIDVRFLIGDIRDKERLDKAMSGVDIIFHGAALKHVPFCEYNPFEAVQTNVYGTQNVIDLAIKHEVDKVVAISTDKAVHPTSIMGTTKLLMEKMVLSTRWYLGDANTKFSIVRFGNVLNSRGSVLPLWLSQIKSGGPLTITDPKMSRFFMTIEDAVDLITHAVTIMKGQEVFVLKMKERTIADMAQEIIKRSSDGKKIEIKIVGMRDGEKMHEELFTAEEIKYSFDLKKFLVIIPYTDLYKNRHASMYRS